MAVHLYDNRTGGNSGSGAFDQIYTWGLDFGVTGTTARAVTALRVFVGAGNNAPTIIRLFDKTASNALIGSVSISGSITSAAWNSFALASAVTLPAGHSFQITASWAGATSMSYFTPGNAGAPPSPYAFGDTWGWYAVGGSSAVLATNNNASIGVALDIVDGGEAGTLPGTGPGTVTGDLVGWFSSDPALNTQQGDLPWLTKAGVDALRAGTDTYYANLATMLTKVRNIVGQSDDVRAFLVSSLLDRYVGDIADIRTALNRTNAAGAGGAGGTVVEDVLGPLAPVIAAYATPAPSTWVSQGVTPFDTNASVIVPADAYTVTFTDLGTASANLTIGTQDVAYRLAWWAISDGERARERRFVDFPMAVVWDEGRRMPGMVLHSPAGGSGIVEAWLLE